MYINIIAPLKIIVWSLYKSMSLPPLPPMLEYICQEAYKEFYFKDNKEAVYGAIVDGQYGLLCHILEKCGHEVENEMLSCAIAHNRHKICTYLIEYWGIYPQYIWNPSLIASIGHDSQQLLFDLSIKYYLK